MNWFSLEKIDVLRDKSTLYQSAKIQYITYLIDFLHIFCQYWKLLNEWFFHTSEAQILGIRWFFRPKFQYLWKPEQHKYTVRESTVLHTKSISSQRFTKKYILWLKVWVFNFFVIITRQFQINCWVFYVKRNHFAPDFYTTEKITMLNSKHKMPLIIALKSCLH